MSRLSGWGLGIESPRECEGGGHSWGVEADWASGSLGPLSLSHLDVWDQRSHFKAQSSAWSTKRGTSGSGRFLAHNTGSLSGDRRASQEALAGARRWQPAFRVGPEGALSPSPGAELRAALAESGSRRAELVRQLREAHGRLDSQTDLLRTRDRQLEHRRTTTRTMELRHKQLAEAVSALEQEREMAELSRFEERRHRGDLQDKVLQLELDMLKMRTTLEKDRDVQPSLSLTHPLQSRATPSSILSRTLPMTKEDVHRQEARAALKECQERAETLEHERDQALQRLRSSEEGHLTALSQVKEMGERLKSTTETQNELQDQLSEARCQLGQTSLERDLLSSKVKRLEDNLEDLKIKLSGAVGNKDRLLQEKVELHHRVQGLELQLERAQRGREDFSEQLSELQGELADAKAQVSHQARDRVQQEEEFHTANQLSERLTYELSEVQRRLEAGLGQLHELEAEKVILANRTEALETERAQLIGEKEVLLQKVQEEAPELRELRESQDSLRRENHELQSRCQGLEGELLEKKVELQRKGEERGWMEAKTAQDLEELRRVGVHWKERWQEAAVALKSKKAELEEAGQQQEPAHMPHKESLAQDLERLQIEVQSNKKQIQTLLQQKAKTEAELHKIKKEHGGLAKVEMDVCRQQLELERSRSQGLQRRLSCVVDAEGLRVCPVQVSPGERDPVLPEGLRSPDGGAPQTQHRGTETELSIPPQEHGQWSTLCHTQIELSPNQQGHIQTICSLAELTELSGGVRSTGPSDQEARSQMGPQAPLQETWGVTMQPQLQPLVKLEQAMQMQQLDQQGKAERKLHEDADHDRQRRLVTEQLKTLFREREQLRRSHAESTGAQRGGRSYQDLATKSKLIQNALETLRRQKRREQELLQEKEELQGAARTAIPGGQQVAPESDKLQEQVAGLREELHSQIPAMRVEITDIRDRNDNLTKAKLQGLPASKLQVGGQGSDQEGVEDTMGPCSHAGDGTFLANRNLSDSPGPAHPPSLALRQASRSSCSPHSLTAH